MPLTYQMFGDETWVQYPSAEGRRNNEDQKRNEENERYAKIDNRRWRITLMVGGTAMALVGLFQNGDEYLKKLKNSPSITRVEPADQSTSGGISTVSQ